MSATILLAVFFTVWVVASAVGFIAKQTRVVSIGGGFILACLAVGVAGALMRNFSAEAAQGSARSHGPQPGSASSNSSPEAPNQGPDTPDLLPEIRAFLRSHSEFGSPIATQPIPDWAHGKRQRVQFTTGRNLLFYLQDGRVLTVYEDFPGDGRVAIWEAQ